MKIGELKALFSDVPMEAAWIHELIESAAPHKYQCQCLGCLLFRVAAINALGNDDNDFDGMVFILRGLSLVDEMERQNRGSGENKYLALALRQRLDAALVILELTHKNNVIETNMRGIYMRGMGYIDDESDST